MENLKRGSVGRGIYPVSYTHLDVYKRQVLFTGGGTYNSYLIERIKSKTQTEIFIPESKIIDFKEALIFAFMGVLRVNNEINVISSSTGSTLDHSSGIIV